MKYNHFNVRKHTGKVDLSKAPAVGNATIKVAKAPFPLVDTTYYQVGPAGDYIQEQGG